MGRSRESRVVGVVLKRQGLSEADEMVTLFTKESGKIRVKAVSVKKISSKLQGNLQLVSFVKLRLVGDGDLPRVASAETVKIYKNIWDDLERANFFYWLSETVIKATPDSTPDEHLYALIKHALDALENPHLDGQALKILLAYTMIRLADFLGFTVHVSSTAVSAVQIVFSYTNGGFMSKTEDVSGVNVDRSVLEDFDTLNNSTAANLPIIMNNIKELLQVLSSHISYQLERPINSTKFVV